MGDLTNSNPTIFPNYPHEQIAAAHQCDDFTYDPDPLGCLRARLAVADYYRAHGANVSPDRILLTASTSEAYALLFKLLCDPADEVLVPGPSYPLFDYLAGVECVRPVPYRLGYDGAWFIDFDNMQAAVTNRTRALVVVSPNNPTGSSIKPEEASRLLAFSKRNDIPLICDEVFLDYPLAATGPLLTFSRFSHAQTFSLSGLSKSAGMPQMKLGWIVVNGEPLGCQAAMDRLELIADTFLSVSTPVQNALPKLLQVGVAIRDGIQAQISENYHAATQILNGSAAQPLRADGGWSLIVQLPGIMTDEEWVDRLMDNYGCIVQPGYFFDLQPLCCVVVSLLTDREDFRNGIMSIRDLVAQHVR